MLNKLERKFGKFAIKNLILYIIIANAIVFVFSLLQPDSNLISTLALVPELVLQGQIWRIITFIFIPPTTSIIFIIFVLYLYYMIGNTLEQHWGSFKFNVYYLLGMLGIIIGSFLTGEVGTNQYLNLSLLLVFAHLFPNMELYLYFILPIKMKHLAIVYWVIIGLAVLSASTIGQKIMIIFPLISFFIFFGKDIINGFKNKKRKKKFEYSINTNKSFSVKDNLPKTYSVHKCTICEKTENDDPNLEFRFCSKCNGFHEYCMEHLKDHKHIE